VDNITRDFESLIGEIVANRILRFDAT